MADRELYPSIRDERKTFRYGTNRMVEIALRHELDDVAKKSVDEIIIKKELERQKPVDNEEFTSRRLRPAFAPRRMRKRMLSEPVFHDELLAQKPKTPQFMLIPNIPPYNPLDKFGNLKEPSWETSRSYPYARENTITTEEMRKARVTSLGVLPTRTSKDVDGLQVIMEGKPVVPSRNDVIDEMQEANLARPITPGTPTEAVQHDLVDDKENDEPKKKPAILGSEGTSVKVALAARPPREPKTKYKYKRRYRGKSGLTSTSLKSETLLPDAEVYSKYDDAIAELDDDLENVQTAVSAQSQRDLLIPTGEEDGRRSGAVSEAAQSVKDMLAEAKMIASPDAEPAQSVKDMLDEAKMIASPDAEPVFKMRKKTPVRKVVKKDTKKGKEKGKAKKEEEKKEGPRTERTVDEIIASLRSQSRTGQVTEADRKIQEIMNRVMSRSTGVDGEGTTETEEERPDKRDGEDAIEEEKDDGTDGDKHDDRKLGDRQVTTDPSMPPAPPSTAMPVQEVEPLQLEKLAESDSDEDTEQIDIKKAWEDYTVPDITYEDLVGVTGTSAPLEGRHPPLPGFKAPPAVPVHSDSVSFLSAWKPVAEKRKREEEEEEKDKRPAKSVHHFCTMTTEYQLPEQFTHTGRKYHTPSRFQFAMPDQKYRFGSRGPSPIDALKTSHSADSQNSKTSEQRRISAVARRVLQEVREEEEGEDNLEAWQQRAEEVFEDPKSKVTADGSYVPMATDESRLYWTPAPPKLDVAPAKVKDILFPEYQRPTVGAVSSEMQEAMEESSSSEEEEEELEITEEDQEQMEQLERMLLRKHHSMEDLTEFVIVGRQREADIKEGKIFPYEPRIIEEKEQKDQKDQKTVDARKESIIEEIKPQEPEPLYPTFPLLRRSSSAPDLMEEEDDTLMVSQDYNTAMEEIQRQKVNVRQMKIQLKLQQQQQEMEALGQVEEEESIEQLQRVDPQEYKADILKVHGTPQKKVDEPTPAELALAAGRAYVILPKKKKKKQMSTVSMARLDDIEHFLKKKPRRLKRCESMIRIPKPLEKQLRVSVKVRDGTRRSMPNLLDFDDFGKRKGLKRSDDKREWVRDIWNTWFDEVFPPTPEDSDYDEEEELTEEQLLAKEEEEKRKKRWKWLYEEEELTEEQLLAKEDGEKRKKRKDSLSSSVPEDMHYIEPITENEENLEVIQIISEEIEKLTTDMDRLEKPKAFDYCRRGALYRKIGYLKAAEDDLTMSIEMEPLLLDAYWHRHLLFVLQDRRKEALEDLTFILKHSKSHAGAYRSMAEIYKRQNDITMAIVNYTAAIKLNPRDHEAYYARAECYERRGDMLLALEDYSSCTKIMPTRVDAILKHGMYYFENKSWNNAISDFTDLLRVDPLNASARVLRGRAYASMGQWSPAVEDLSAAIHLDPNHWEAFYHRACILRRAHPKRALHDFSVSLMINDSESNVSSYLHRGILYNAMGKPEDAIPDFESVLKLNKDNACSHVNLGLIMMTHYGNYHRAIKRFTSAIKVDPTYVRAYVCRGEAYHKIHETKLALRDFTRAIHLRPDIHHYYMYRGQLLLELGQLDLAAFCVRQASELSGSESSYGQRPTQQAVVHSFLNNYEKAIDALRSATRTKPVAGMYMLLGKTQMKAKKFSDAADSFHLALELYKPWKARDPWPVEAADSHYLAGMCHMELRNYLRALEAFTSAIKLNPNMAEALYQRGITKMKLKMTKGIQDFNRALALNPTIFQAYLSRACYYGMKGNYTKAILNCNEAIKLQPNSVRAYLYRGALKYHIKAYELAIRDLSKAASVDSSCALAYFNRAVCYQESKEYQKALTDYGIVLLIGDQLKLKVLINRGMLYFEQKDYLNALYDFKMAASMDPKDHKILHTLGLCYHKLGQLGEAIKTFSECVVKQPFFLDGIIARGNVYMDFGNEAGLKQAMHDYQRVLRYDPMCLPARINLAYTLQVSGRFMQAWRQFSTAIDIKPNYKPALEGRSIISLQMSDTFASYQDINAAIKVNPTAELLTNRGVIHQFMNDRVNAMRDYQEALHLDPRYALAYFNAANVYFQTRHFSQALDYYSKAVIFNPKDESALLNRAITKVMMKDAQGALTDFKSAITLSPYSAHMYLNRGNLYASMQQFDKAEKDYTRGMEAMKSHIAYCLDLNQLPSIVVGTRSHAKIGAIGLAYTALDYADVNADAPRNQSALDLQPDDPLVLKRRADVRGKLGKKSAAVSDYKQAIELQGRIEYLRKTA